MVGGHFSQCIMDNLMTLGLVTISLLLGGKFIRFQSSYEFISLLFHKFRSNMLQSMFHIGTSVLQQNVFSVDNQYHQIKNPGRLCCYLIMPLKCMSLNQLSSMITLLNIIIFHFPKCWMQHKVASTDSAVVCKRGIQLLVITLTN